MKRLLSPCRWLILAALALAVGCATTEKRIESDQALFDSYEPAVQQNIRNGIIEVGYTPEMVEMALGEPDRKDHIEAPEGATEVWTYQKSRPGIGIGLGSGVGVGSRTGIGTGVSVGKPATKEDQAVVEFVDGRVVRFSTPSQR